MNNKYFKVITIIAVIMVITIVLMPLIHNIYNISTKDIIEGILKFLTSLVSKDA